MDNEDYFSHITPTMKKDIPAPLTLTLDWSIQLTVHQSADMQLKLQEMCRVQAKTRKKVVVVLNKNKYINRQILNGISGSANSVVINIRYQPKSCDFIAN